VSYQVFALKWRPQRFEDVVGQEHVTRPLQNAIRENRVPHAFLLTGGRGVGKTTTARILAKALVCEHGPSPEPCNECRFCREVTAGGAMDIVEMDAASNRGIEDVRDLRESLNYAPASARYKIYIVDEVHMLTKEAFNAFLKTLEEPPPYVKFIFATTDLHKVPITIQSRCQRYDFRLLERAEIVEQLRRIVEAEGITMSPAALAAVASAGEGSMRDAESLLEQVVAYCGRIVRDEEVAAALGLPAEKTLLAFCSDLLGRRGAACLATLDAVAALGMDARVYAREVLGMLRNLAVLRAAPEAADLVPVTAETLAELRPLAAAASSGHLQSLFEIFLRVETEVRNATFPRMLLELAVLRAVRLEEVQEIATLLERLEQFERRLAAGGWSAPAPETAPHPPESGVAAKPEPASPPEEDPWEGYDALAPPEAAAKAEFSRRAPLSEPPAPLEAPAASATAVAGAPVSGDFFALFLERVQREKGMLAGILEHGRLLKAADGVLEVGFAAHDSFFLETAREAQNITFLRTLARELLGGRTEVRLTTLDGDGAEPAAHARAPRETDAHRKHRHEALNAPALGWAVEILQAQIVDVKIEN
jgi:DNA polymerase-3 subunit gamma/tau